jgi:hypothetical protein
MSNNAEVPALEERQPGRRRQYTAEQKRALLENRRTDAGHGDQALTHGVSLCDRFQLVVGVFNFR